ncbi:hypothetical protein C9374_011401 [Naegleria lovaniensis]|uniref:Beta-lactamase-related domain-containing protein n=1 Tax=Naegleria lovaniensis TaxID=51637 RepID=A0AA88KQR2_NAELO|nr:uncharacterized protein C9374_011401 [Naegleria lovaniensis]KAG2392676.1 hypothetical protein C9374_011401 [Naegleria lovaniensis]
MTKATTTGHSGSHRRKHKFQRSGLPTTGFVIITVLAVLLASAYYAEAGSSASSMLKRNNNFVRVIEKYKYLQKSLRLSEMKKKDEMVFSSDFNQRKTSIYDNISNVFDTIYQNISSYEYGIVVVINKKGDVLFSKSYGTKEPFGWPSKNSSYLDDIFAISEVSSSFTATSMLHLSEKGILGGNFDNLDANQYLPDSLKFKPEIIGNFGSVLGHPVISSNDTVTIGSLLTHTTGLDSRLVGSCSRSKVHESEENASEFLLHYLESMRVPRIRKYDFVSSFSHIPFITQPYHLCFVNWWMNLQNSKN